MFTRDALRKRTLTRKYYSLLVGKYTLLLHFQLDISAAFLPHEKRFHFLRQDLPTYGTLKLIYNSYSSYEESV